MLAPSVTTTSLGDSDWTCPLTRPPIACLTVVPADQRDVVGAAHEAARHAAQLSAIDASTGSVRASGEWRVASGE